MGRLIVIALLASLLVRALTGQWPWQLWATSERAQAEAQARALLGVDRGARREEVLDAHRRLLACVHPDRGGTNEQVHEANRARDLLLARLERQEGGQ
ncbi:MAG: molecular chaperone DnaJ [Novosphingobium sp.]|uniref:molecular chaperone DnaJ n=1 Tax=Novosphingobium sp. TaxID=1874826 RepID=UPI002624B23C|nr:molecular chaperone DnaJ [Novosphingobium sp.]MCP5386220.1 molecular chaperone DnaJ [Novosphingobium sp.]